MFSLNPHPNGGRGNPPARQPPARRPTNVTPATRPEQGDFLRLAQEVQRISTFAVRTRGTQEVHFMVPAGGGLSVTVMMANTNNGGDVYFCSPSVEVEDPPLALCLHCLVHSGSHGAWECHERGGVPWFSVFAIRALAVCTPNEALDVIESIAQKFTSFKEFRARRG